MQASTYHPFQSSLNPSSPESSPRQNYGAIRRLLDLGVTKSNAQGAYLYAVDLANSAARLVLWSGLSPVAATLPLELEGPAIKAVFSRISPLVLQEWAWRHTSFKALPEFRKNRFEGVVSIPLLESGQVIGLWNVCRSERAGLKPREFSFLLNLGVSIGALVAASGAQANLEHEVDKLTRQLYASALTGETHGRAHLPAIRKEGARRAGKILSIGGSSLDSSFHFER
jgi:signal transduction protein with GAF and PtsI domain